MMFEECKCDKCGEMCSSLYFAVFRVKDRITTNKYEICEKCFLKMFKTFGGEGEA